jgi:hypothetical protein
MDALTYTGLVLLSFTGLITGYIIAYLTKEELHTGERFFYLLQDIVFVLIVLVSAYSLNQQLIWKILFLVIIILLSLILRKMFAGSRLAYVIFTAIVLIISDSALLYVVCSMIFIYGLCTGSLLAKKAIDKGKNLWPSLIIIKRYLFFAFVSSVIYIAWSIIKDRLH